MFLSLIESTALAGSLNVQAACSRAALAARLQFCAESLPQSSGTVVLTTERPASAHVRVLTLRKPHTVRVYLSTTRG